MQNFLHIECPSCHTKYSVDKDEVQKPRIVKCVECGYQWLYEAKNEGAENHEASRNHFVGEESRESDDRGDFDYDLEDIHSDHKEHDDDIQNVKIDERQDHEEEIESKEKDLDDIFKELDDDHEVQEEKDRDVDFDDLFADLDDTKKVQEAKINKVIEEKDDFDDLFSDLDNIKNKKSVKDEEIEEEEEEEESEEYDENEVYDEDEEEDDGLDDNDERHDEKESHDSGKSEDNDHFEDKHDLLGGKEEENLEGHEDLEESEDGDEDNLTQRLIKYGAIGLLLLMLFGFLFSLGLNSYSALPRWMKSIFSVFGVKNIDGLEIVDLKPKIIINGENSFNIIVNGNIMNLSNSEKDIPEIQIIVYDKNNNEHSYLFHLDKRSLQSMEYQKFNYKIFAINFEPTKIEARLTHGIEKYVKYK